MAFYKCPRCKAIWQYPIEKCPECFSNLERMKETKAKIVSISQVDIPTIFHPKVPYFVLVLKDETGNRWVQKSVVRYNVGDDFKENNYSGNDKVAIWRIKYDILEAIDKVIGLLGGIQVDQASRILILPTLEKPTYPYLAENTSPDFLEAFINYLLSKGAVAKNIKIAAQSFNEIPIEVSAQKSQLFEVCKKYQIVPVNLSKTHFVRREIDGLSLEITEEVFRANLVVNLPIFRLDKKLGVKGASENLTKFLKKESYFASVYLTDLSQLIKDLERILPKHLTIAEGLKVQRTSGINAFLGLVLGGFNDLYIDRVLAEIVMKRNLIDCLEKVKIGDISIIGRKIEEVQYDFEKPF